MRKRTKTLFFILIFVMAMAISAAMTRVWIEEQTVPTGSLHDISQDEPALHLMKDELPTQANRNLMRLHAPAVGSVVTSPLPVAGEARGYWFFEADAPMHIEDAEGNVLGEGYIQTVGDWMTEDFVDWTGEIEFDEPTTSTGMLVLKNANASGEPERDIFLHIPVRFE